MSSSAGFSLTEFGSQWPSGNFAEIAMIDVSCDDVIKLVSRDLFEGIEEGMGPWKAIGLRLDSGGVIELIRYEYDSDQAFTLRADANSNFSEVLEDTLDLLGKGIDSLQWVSPLVNERKNL